MMCCILSVDDSPIPLKILNKALEGMVSCSVISANNGKEAVDNVVEAAGKIHLIFMDIHMPTMDGYNATKEIKRRFPHIPIISYSTLLPTEICVTSNDFNEHLSKNPFNFAQLYTLLKQFVPSLLKINILADEKISGSGSAFVHKLLVKPAESKLKEKVRKDHNKNQTTSSVTSSRASSTPTPTRRMATASLPCNAEYQRLSWLISPSFLSRKLPPDSCETRTNLLPLVRG